MSEIEERIETTSGQVGTPSDAGNAEGSKMADQTANQSVEAPSANESGAVGGEAVTAADRNEVTDQKADEGQENPTVETPKESASEEGENGPKSSDENQEGKAVEIVEESEPAVEENGEKTSQEPEAASGKESQDVQTPAETEKIEEQEISNAKTETEPEELKAEEVNEESPPAAEKCNEAAVLPVGASEPEVEVPAECDNAPIVEEKQLDTDVSDAKALTEPVDSKAEDAKEESQSVPEKSDTTLAVSDLLKDASSLFFCAPLVGKKSPDSTEIPVVVIDAASEEEAVAAVEASSREEVQEASNTTEENQVEATTEVSSSDAIPEAAAPEAATPEPAVATPEAEAATPEVDVPEAATPETATPEPAVATPEPEVAAPEAAAPEAASEPPTEPESVAQPEAADVKEEAKKPKPPQVLPKPKIDVPERKIELYVKAHARFPSKIGDCPFCHRIMMTLKIKKIGGSVCPVNLNIKTAEFEDLCAKNGLPTKVPILRHGDTVIGDSNVIADYLDKLKPIPDLVCKDKKVIAAGDKIFLKFSAFVKNKVKSNDDKLRQGLVDELQRLDTFLGTTPGVFLDGDEMKHPDCSLLPKLHHVRVASKQYKKFDMPENLVHLNAYLAAADNHPAFNLTAPAKDAIIEGWRKHVS